MKTDVNSHIIYEDSQIIVCHKPAGIAVQSARLGEKDMESLLKNYLATPLAQNVRTDHARKTPHPKRKPSVAAPYLAVIHRLDQPVEGLLVFAKTPESAKKLNAQLTSSGFAKYYRAIVSGTPAPPEGTLEDYMVKDARTNSSHVCKRDTHGAKLARLHYKTLETYPAVSPLDNSTSLIEIKLDTGRHHQIRVQMSHLGCPLAGDRKYGYNALGDRKNAEPLRLCAYKLCFKHPSSGREMVFELPRLPF